TKWGKGFESIPRNLSLRRFSDGLRLVQTPILALKKLRKDSSSLKNVNVQGIKELKKIETFRNIYELEITFSNISATSFGLNLLVGSGRELSLTYKVED